MSLRETARAVASGKLSARGLAQQALERAEAKNPALNAIVRLRAQAALSEAAAIDRRVAAGEDPGVLAGVPVLIKDNLALEGTEVTACSRILKGFVPPYTATAVRKLQQAGAVIIGQTNMDEFAMGSSTEHSCYGPCRNPRDVACVPGGSSGGSAAAVAAGIAPLALGTDTGGSIRQPAAFCGVVGLKPTYGRVSRYGLFAYGSSLDQIGPLTHSVADAALALSVIEGRDDLDATSLAAPGPAHVYGEGVRGLRIAVPREFMDTSKGLRREVASLLRDLLDRLAREGAEIREVSLPVLDYVIPVYYLIAVSEASSNLARYDGVRYGLRSGAGKSLAELYGRTRAEGFGREAQVRVLLGTYALSAGYSDAYYKKADRLRRHLRGRMDAIFRDVDVVVGPTAPDVAFRLGEKLSDPLSMYMQDLYTTLANLVQSPAMSVPCGEVDGLPVGVQIMGRPFGEADVFRAGTAAEQVCAAVS